MCKESISDRTPKQTQDNWWGVCLDEFCQAGSGLEVYKDTLDFFRGDFSLLLANHEDFVNNVRKVVDVVLGRAVVLFGLIVDCQTLVSNDKWNLIRVHCFTVEILFNMIVYILWYKVKNCRINRWKNWKYLNELNMTK
jgi:hypothetical protein